MTKKASLPTWKLNDLYSGPNDPAIARQMSKAKKGALAFAKKYRGKVSKQLGSVKKAKGMLEAYEEACEAVVKPVVFASLRFAETSTEPGRGAFLQGLRSQANEIYNLLIFFELELLKAKRSELSKLAKQKDFQEYRNYLLQLQKQSAHRLSEREEQIFSDKALTGASAFVRLFTEEHSRARYEFRKGKKTLQLSETETLHFLHSGKRAERKEAARAMSEGLKAHAHRYAFIYNMLVLDKKTNDRYRSFENAEQSRHLANHTDQKSVDALVSSVRGSFRLVEDFYLHKKELLGLKTLYDYDRYAPVAKSSKQVSWKQAKEWVVDAFFEFSEEFGVAAKRFFDEKWIDAADRPGKRGGAFCQMGYPGMHPWVFMNFRGSMRDVFTLAHELGHGIHGYFMREEQSYLNFDPPLTVCETASVFSEMILFRHLQERIRSERQMQALLVQKIDDIFATVQRQTSMYLFEKDVHEGVRKSGELEVAELNRIWRKRQEEMYRGSVTLTANYDYWWSYIPHFMGSPFYVYAYSFGELLTLALYQQFESGAVKNFEEKFLSMLAAGSSQSPHELVRPFGAKLSEKSFWNQGTRFIANMIKDLKALS